MAKAGYVTTIEEYQHQRYEGGSTAYGPHTHGAMTNILREMAEEARWHTVSCACHAHWFERFVSQREIVFCRKLLTYSLATVVVSFLHRLSMLITFKT